MSPAVKLTQAIIVGGGRMGSDIALVLARGGRRSHIIEPSALRRDSLPAYFDQATGDQRPWRSFVTIGDSWNEAPWSTTGLVVECVPERLAKKQEVFREVVQRAGRDTLITTNTSSLTISAITDGHATADRMLGWHFFHPAQLVPLVEIIRGPQTSDAVVDSLVAFSQQCRLVPIRVNKDVPGFVANRLQHAIAREAYALVEAGVASIDDIDHAVRFGFGFRYLAAGPFLQRDHGGLDVHLAAAEAIFPTLASQPDVPRLLRDRVAAGKFGLSTGGGFYPWSPAAAAAEKVRYRQALEQALALLEKEIPRAD